MKSTIQVTLFLFALGVVTGACREARLPQPTPAQKGVAAEVKLTDALAKCVEDSPTPALSDACAERVRAYWTKDGGR